MIRIPYIFKPDITDLCSCKCQTPSPEARASQQTDALPALPATLPLPQKVACSRTEEILLVMDKK
jgi:hypothetical protein